MAHGHVRGHGSPYPDAHKPRPEKPRHEKAREKALHEKAHKPPSHGATPNALEKAVRGHGSHGMSRHRVEKQLQHEKEKRGQSTAPNKLEKALRGHTLHRSEKQQKPEEQKHEQHRGERTPNKLEKALREHALPRDEKQQKGETRFPHEKSQDLLRDLPLPEAFKKIMDKYQHETAKIIRDSWVLGHADKLHLLYTLGQISLDEYQKALSAPYLALLQPLFSLDTEKSFKEESMTREPEQQKPEQQKPEQQSRETPNKLEKAVREHASQGSEQQAHDKSLHSEKQVDTRTPGTLEKSSGEKPQQSHDRSQPQQSHDRSQPQERRPSVSTPNALDKSVRAHRDESKKDDPTRSHHDQTLSAKEREERLRIATPADSVGFQFGSAQLVPGMMEQWLANQPEQLRTALSDPAAKVIITASASRPGSEESNLRLSEARTTAVQQWLREHGVHAQIVTHALGEEPAKQARKSDQADDASDRVAKIEVIPPVAKAETSAPSFRDHAPEVPKDPEVNFGRELLKEYAEHKGIEKISEETAQKLVGKLGTHFVGPIIEVGVYQVQALLKLGEANEAGTKEMCLNKYVSEYATAVAKLTQANPGEVTGSYEKQQRLPHDDFKRLIENMPSAILNPNGLTQALNAIASTAHRDALSAVIQLGEKGVQEFRNKYPDYEARRQVVLQALYPNENRENQYSSEKEQQHSQKQQSSTESNAFGKSVQPKQQSEKQQQQPEKGYSTATSNTSERYVRGQQQDAGKGDQVVSKHDQTLSAKEREERLRIATPADSVGFQFGSAQLVPGMMEQWLASQPEQLRTALSDPAAKVIITASASRSGSNDSNLQLTVGRGDSVQQWLRDHGVQASIEIYAVGEEPAKQAGKPDGVDDASDRAAKIEVIPANKMERSIDLAQLLQEANAAITDYARTHGELAPFVKSDIFGYEYRKDTIIGREEPGKPSTDHVAAMTALKFYPEAFFPFHVVSKNNIKSIVLKGEYDLISRIDSPRLPPGNNPVRVTEVTPTSFTFTALEGHFDPPGSTITFTTWVDNNRNIHLEQYGRAKSYDPSSNYIFAPKVAAIAWDEQAANLRKWLEMGGLSPSHLADPWK